MKTTFEQRIILAISLLFLVFIGLFIAFRSTVEKRRLTNDLIKHEQTLLRHNDNILLAVVNIQSGVRGYVITGDDIFLEQYTNAKNTINQGILELRNLYIDNSQQKIKIDSLEKLIHERIAFSSKNIEVRKNNGFEEAQKRIASHEGKLITEEIRAIIEEIKKEEENVLLQGISENERSVHNSEFAFNTLLVITAIIFTLITFLILKNQKTRIKAEVALKETNEYLENLFRYTNAPIIVWDTQLNITRFNPAFEKLTGRKSIEVIGKSIEILFPPELIEESMEHFKKLQKGEQLETIEIIIIHANGTRYTVLWNLAPILDANGNKIIATIAQGQDITKRKQAEENLKVTLNSLEISNSELEQFAYVASHDLQEPLRMISSYTQLLERRYKDKLDDDANDFIHFAVDGANRMQKLINDLLEFSRVSTRGKDFETIDTSGILGRVISNLQLMIADNSALITNDDLPMINGDESQILRVFQNLIENAIKFRKKSENPRIHVSCRKKNNLYEFSVQDNGIGVEMQYHDKVFVIFQRLHSTKEYPGTGIGLSISKRIIERHGGKLWFESKVNEGATFYFTLPI
jgi:PAS domain S-box-containing protein